MAKRFFRRPSAAVHRTVFALDDIIVVTAAAAAHAGRIGRKRHMLLRHLRRPSALKRQHQQNGRRRGHKARTEQQKPGHGIAYRPQHLISRHLPAAACRRSRKQDTRQTHAAQHKHTGHRAEHHKHESHAAYPPDHPKDGHHLQHAETQQTETDITHNRILSSTTVTAIHPARDGKIQPAARNFNAARHPFRGKKK